MFAKDFWHAVGMSSEPLQWQHLADVVNARMKELDLNNERIGNAEGPSTTTISKIRNARASTISDETYRKLDRSLRWRKGSARQVHLGGDPVPLPLDWDVRDIVVEIELSNLSAETKRTILRLLSNDGQVKGA